MDISIEKYKHIGEETMGGFKEEVLLAWVLKSVKILKGRKKRKSIESKSNIMEYI